MDWTDKLFVAQPGTEQPDRFFLIFLGPSRNILLV